MLWKKNDTQMCLRNLARFRLYLVVRAGTPGHLYILAKFGHGIKP
jgi:hypothetical protein